MALYNPVWGICYYVGLTIIRPEMLTYGTSHIRHIFPFAQGAILVSTVLAKNFKLEKVMNSQFLFFFLFVLGLVVSTQLSPYEHYLSYRFNKTLILIFLLCVTIKMNILDITNVRLYYNSIIYLLMFLGLWGVQQSILGNPDLGGLFGRFIPDRCGICAVFTLYFPLGIYKILTRKTKIDLIIGLTATILFITDIVLTYSRAGFLGLACSVLWIVKGFKHKVKISFLVAAVFVLSLFVLPEDYTTRISGMFEKNLAETEERVEDTSAAGRVVMWRAAMLVFKENLLFGVGPLNFPEAGYSKGEYFKGKINDGLWLKLFGNPNFKLLAHNMFVNILAEGGLISSVPFYLFILISFRENAGILKYQGDDKETMELVILSKCIRAGLIGYCVASAFANMRYVDFFYWQLTMLPIVTGLAMKRIEATSGLRELDYQMSEAQKE